MSISFFRRFAEVIEMDLRSVPSGLAAQFLEHECLNEMAKGLTIVGKAPRVEPKQRASHPGIPHVNLGRLDQPAYSVAVPRR